MASRELRRSSADGKLPQLVDFSAIRVSDAKAHPWSVGNGIPLDIDSHDIPANPAKREGPHVHHDFQFLTVAHERPELQAQLMEVHEAKWVPVRELANSPDSRVRRVYEKLQAVGAISV